MSVSVCCRRMERSYKIDMAEAHSVAIDKKYWPGLGQFMYRLLTQRMVSAVAFDVAAGKSVSGMRSQTYSSYSIAAEITHKGPRIKIVVTDASIDDDDNPDPDPDPSRKFRNAYENGQRVAVFLLTGTGRRWQLDQIDGEPLFAVEYIEARDLLLTASPQWRDEPVVRISHDPPPVRRQGRHREDAPEAGGRRRGGVSYSQRGEFGASTTSVPNNTSQINGDMKMSIFSIDSDNVGVMRLGADLNGHASLQSQIGIVSANVGLMGVVFNNTVMGIGTIGVGCESEREIARMCIGDQAQARISMTLSGVCDCINDTEFVVSRSREMGVEAMLPGPQDVLALMSRCAAWREQQSFPLAH